jgi:DNA-binding response OmpR family regulator
MERVEGLDAGADDYVTKPFSVAELVSRVNAILRRRRLDAAEVSTPTVSHGGLRLDLAGRAVEVDGVQVRLTPSEFDLLYLLASSPGQVFSRRAIMEHLWKGTYFGDGRTVDTHVASIRRKIERDPAHPTRLLTSHGHGYKLSRELERVR